MRFASLIACATLGAATPGVVQFDLQGHRVSSPRRGSNLQARDSKASSIDLKNDLTYYSANISIGDPAQKLMVQIDTGSSDLWVMAADNPYCATTKRQKQLAALGQGYVDCDAIGTFDYNSSSSFSWNDTDFSIEYADTTMAEGRWATDKISLSSDLTLDKASFAVGLESNSTNAVFGIGLTSQESTLSTDRSTYSNFPLQLYQEGKIAAYAYSLYLNDLNADTGSLLFGGIDHDKYSGTLQLLPFVSQSGRGQATTFSVMLSSISASSASDGSNAETLMSSNIPMVLDSGTTFTMLPSKVVEAIGEALGGEFSREMGYYLQSCELAGSLVFSFNGLDITVPLSEFMVPLVSSTDPSQTATFDDGTPACAIALQASEDYYILGDNFLRSAYVVYDLENLQVAMAPTKFNSTSTNIETIGSDGIPSASTASGYSSTQMANSISVNNKPTVTFGTVAATGLSGSAGIGGDVTGTLDVSASGSAQATSSSSSSSSSSGDSSSSGSSSGAPSTTLATSVLLLIVPFLSIFI